MLQLLMMEQVVSHESSSLEYGPERKQPIEANHTEMCRFSGKGDPHCIQVQEALMRYNKSLHDESTAQEQGSLPEPFYTS